MVKLQAMLPDWVMMATPRVDGVDAMFIGPEGGARQAIDEAIAVGAHEAACRLLPPAALPAGALSPVSAKPEA